MAKQQRSIKPSEKEAILKKEAVELMTEARVPHITEFEDLVDTVPDLCAEYRAIAQQIAPLEVRKKEIGEELKALLDAAEIGSVRGDNWIATRSADTFTEKIVPELLLAAGVTMGQIQAGIRQEPRKGYVQVKELKNG